MQTVSNTTVIQVTDPQDIKRFRAKEEYNDHQGARQIALMYTTDEEAERIIERLEQLEDTDIGPKLQDERQALIVEFYQKFTIVLSERPLALK